MQKTRLIQFLRSLTPLEMKGLKDVILSPAFNKNEQLINLFEILEGYYPDFGSEDLEEEIIFGKLYISEEYDYFKMKNLTSDLLALGKEYLAFTSYKKNQEKKDTLLLWELRIRNLDVLYEHTFKNALKRLENKAVKDDGYLAHRIELQSEKLNYYTPKMPNVHFGLMQEKLDLQIEYALLSLLKTYNIMLHEYSQNNVNFDLKMFKEVMDYLKRNIDENNPTILIYYQVILLTMEKTDENFHRLNELRIKFKNELSLYDDHMLFIHLDSYCATAYNLHGRTDLMRIQFELGKEYDQNLFPELGRVLYPNFLNEIKKAVRLNEFEYAEKYIEKYSENLSEEKENTLFFCQGYIAYGKKNYDEALDLFSKTSFSNFIIKIQVKLLLLQLYYEKDFYDQGILMIDTIRKYIAREKMLIENTKASLLGFLKIFWSLIKYRSETGINRNTETLLNIEYQIKNFNNNQFGIRHWLEEKLQELK